MNRVEKMREYRRKWALNNRDKVNAGRRRRRLAKRLAKMQGKHCLLCEIRMVSGGCRYATLYCNDCWARLKDKVIQDIRKRKRLEKKTYAQRNTPRTTN